jgi:serine/threonine protein kinase
MTPGTRIGNRYTVTALLGRGAIGPVYRARDDERGVDVAIRTIAFHDGTDPGTRTEIERRFEREAQRARQIAHPNVVPIHDIFELEGQRFLTMPLVEGETLGAMIHRIGPLAVPDVVNIAKQMADGLVAAHDLGVVHRDLKPENVIISGDHVAIMDFGIAKSNATQTGAAGISGAVEYMAPEQSHGAGVDGRADIYAFGLIVYDMATGRKRLHGHDSAMAELLFRMRNPPPALRKALPEAPAALDALVSKATQPDPDRRFASAAQLLSALSPLTADGAAKAGRRSWWPW